MSEKRISIASIEWLRPFDTSDGCKKFEFKSGSRVYLLEASSNPEMSSWLSSIQMILDEQKAVQIQVSHDAV